MIAIASLALSALAQDLDFEVVVQGAHVMYVSYDIAYSKDIKFKVHNNTDETLEDVVVDLVVVQAWEYQFSDFVIGLDDYSNCAEEFTVDDVWPTDLKATCTIATLGPGRSRIFRLEFFADTLDVDMEFVVGGNASVVIGTGWDADILSGSDVVTLPIVER